MILQSLYEYYQRKQDDLPPYGFQIKEIPFVITLKSDGQFNGLADTRQPNKQKRLEAYPFRVPKERERTGSNAWQRANLLWDHYGFVLSHPATNTPKDVEKARKQFGTFQQMVTDLAAEHPDDQELKAIHAFYEQKQYKQVGLDPKWPDCAKIKGCNLTFKIAGQEGTITDNANVKSMAAAYYEQEKQDDEDETDDVAEKVIAFCPVSEEIGPIARTHPRTPIRNAKTNAKLVSFQKHKGFDSYGKEQGSNAPIGKRAAFAYTTALNHLLYSPQYLQIGDASAVFWAAADSRMELLLSQFFDEPPLENPDQGTNAVKELFEAPLAGTPAIYDDGTRFYVLGLAPNAARIAVRFWHVATVGDLARHIRQHFEDLEIVRPQFVQRPFLSLKALLIGVSPLGDLDKLPPKLAGDFMKAILDGTLYPQTLLQAALRRIHAEQAKKDEKGRQKEHVTYARAALIKAWLNRLTRSANSDQEREFTMSLDESNINSGYRLGRLFAVLEFVQQDAAGGPNKINTTIRDSYFGAASSTPSAVFPTLMRRNQHHMTKLRKEKPGLYVMRDKLIRVICNDGIDGKLGFSPVLSLADQGRFIIGYYQQRQDLFTKS